MPKDLFYVSCNGSTNKAGIEITVTTTNGEFVVDQYTVGVFYGLPPGFTGNYPVTQYKISQTVLDFQGNINSVYSELRVQSTDNALIGTIQANPALPVPVSIGSYGGKGSFTLPAGTLSASFKIPIANYGAEAENQRTSRLAAILDGAGS